MSKFFSYPVQSSGGGGGSLTGSGTATQVAVFDATTSLTSYAGLVYLDTISLTVAGDILPDADSVRNIGSDALKYEIAYLNNYLAVGVDQNPGNGIIFVQSHSGDGGSARPEIYMRDGGGDAIRIRPAGGSFGLEDVVMASAAADALTLTNGPTGTAGDPNAYLRIFVNGSYYAIPMWQLP